MSAYRTRFRVEIWGTDRAECASALRRLADDIGDPADDPTTEFRLTREDAGRAVLWVDDDVTRDAQPPSDPPAAPPARQDGAGRVSHRAGGDRQP